MWYGKIDTHIAGAMKYKTPLKHLKKAIWQYISGVLEIILPFVSAILPPVCNLKKRKKKKVNKGFHRKSWWSVIRAKQNKMKQSKCPTKR